MNIFKRRSAQNGMMTLVMSMVIVFIIGLISIYAAQVSVVEQKISANHYRTVQAFEAAQAGLDTVLQKLKPRLVKEFFKSNPDATGTLSDLQNAGVVIGNLPKDQNANSLGRYDFIFKQDNLDSTMIELTVNGYAGDNNSDKPNQVINEKLLFLPLIAYQPPAPLIARKDISVLSNDINITNMTGDPTAAIWAGGTAKTSGSLTPCSSKSNCSGNSIQVAANINTPNGGGISSQNDTKLGSLSEDNFFENFFTETRNRLKQKADYLIDCSNGCTSTVLFGNNGSSLSGIIWVDTFNSSNNSFKTLTINDGITLGSNASPVILIVNGELEINHADANISGIVYTTQDFNNSNAVGRVNGSIISEQNINITGKFDIIYNNTIMENLIDDTAKFVRLPGSWRDF